MTETAESFGPDCITLVVAMTKDGVIGDDGKLPWHLPEDLRLFRELTLDGTIIMGRKTFESLPGPLDRRHNLVVGRPVKQQAGCIYFPTLKLALEKARSLNQPTFIIGGAQLYRAALPLCDRLVVSWVTSAASGDTLFPDHDWNAWTLSEEETHTGFKRSFYHRKPNGT